MAYDTQLADRIRAVVRGRKGIAEKEMFGGLAFLVDGKMFIGIVKDDLMVRVGPDRHDEAMARPHVRLMDFAGRPMRGYVYVAPPGCRTASALAAWIDWSEAVGRAVKKKAKRSTERGKLAARPLPPRLAALKRKR
jgi:TfoX/Sxy family transcriptional regulator of competence genes